VLWHGAECARNCTTGPTVTADLWEGSAAARLVELSAGAELVVLGSRGTTRGVARGVAASVADEVVAGARCPVVVVKGAGALPHRPHPGAIVAGVSGDDDHVLEFAYQEAAMRGLPLVAVHAWRYPMCATGAFSLQPHPLSGQVVGAITEHWEAAYPAVRTVHRLMEGPVDEVLTRAAAGATLLVVGAADTPGPLDRIGSVTRPVLRRAVCPVAVVPHGAGRRSPLRTSDPRATAVAADYSVTC
jgi:nucleotide-binding universal stress UspA family protein